MNGSFSRLERQKASTSVGFFGLPQDAHALVAAKLPLSDVARMAAASRGFDQISRQDQRWISLQLGRSKSWHPLLAPSRQAVGTMLVSYGRVERRDDALKEMHEQGMPLNENSLIEAELLCWFKQESQNSHPEAAGLAALLIQKSLKTSEELNLGKLPIRTLPHCIGKILDIRYLNLHRTDIQHLPDSIGDLSCLQSLSLVDCVHLTELPETIGNLSNLQGLNLHGCTGLLGKLLPAGLARSEVEVRGPSFGRQRPTRRPMSPSLSIQLHRLLSEEDFNSVRARP